MYRVYWITKEDKIEAFNWRNLKEAQNEKRIHESRGEYCFIMNKAFPDGAEDILRLWRKLDQLNFMDHMDLQDKIEKIEAGL